MQPSYTGSCNVVASNVAAERHCVALVLGRSQLTFEFTCVVTAHDCVAIWVVSRVVSLCLQFWGSGSLQNPASHRSWRFSSLPLAMCPQSLLVFHDWRFWRILASYLMPRPSFWVSLMFFHDQVEAVHVGEGCHRDRPLWGVVCGVHDVRTCCRRSEPLSWGRTGVSWNSRWWSYWFLGNN